jgi:lysophospholipase L1-like esterase
MQRVCVSGASFVLLFASLLVPAALSAQQQGGAPEAPGAAAPAIPGQAPSVPGGGGRRGRGPLPPLGPTTEPTPPREGAAGLYEKTHLGFVEIAKAGNVDVLFVGDSITDWWDQAQRGLPVWNEYFVPLKAATFGIAGDTTQGVLWRMRNGELDGFKAKLIVFMLGTNNINRNPNDQIAEGNRAIIQEFRTRQPQAKVLVLGVFPRGAQPTSQYRAAIKEINAKLETMADNKNVFYMDIGDKFLAPDGSIPADVMPDALHPSEKGYRIWAEAINAKVKELLK